MRLLGIVVNLFLPGLGTIVAGMVRKGILQILLLVFGLVVVVTTSHLIGGIVVAGVWFWSIYAVVTMPRTPDSTEFAH